MAAALDHYRAGRVAEAAGLFRRLLCRRPADGDALHLLGISLSIAGLVLRAITAGGQAASYLSSLGNLSRRTGRLAIAVTCHRRALIVAPDLAEVHSSLANALRESSLLGMAGRHCRHALAIRPEFAECHHNLAIIRQDQGCLDEAIAGFQRAIELKPDYLEPSYNLLFAQLYRPGVSLAGVFAQAARWHASHPVPLAAGQAGPDRQVCRLGFVSGDLRGHAVGYMVIPAIEALARRGYEVVIYSNNAIEDALTLRCRRVASDWRQIDGLADEEAAALIRADRIDILFDLSGFTAHNRILLFACKPAPVQIAWAGYPATTGLAAMDYILADRHQLPAEAESWYSEHALRLPDSYVAFEPPQDAPSLTDLPAEAKGWITFGSFNVLKKLSPEAIALWSRLLLDLPEARLLIKTPALSCAETRRHLTERFTVRGIEGHRLTLLGGSTSAEHQAAMAGADIALDSFPYAGGVTTLECLWMGLPVITLPGETFASRHSLSYLASLGLEELVAGDVDDYRRFAIDLANDRPRLAAMRATLRARMRSSALCDVEAFADHLSAALQAVWRRHRERLPPAALNVARQDDLRRAAALHAGGQVELADRLYRRILTVMPDSADALHLTGVVAHQQGRHHQAVQEIMRAVTVSRGTSVMWANLGEALRERGDNALSEIVQRRSLVLEPGHRQGLYNLAVATAQQGRFSCARILYSRVLQIAPDYAEAWFNMADLCRGAGALAAAINACERALVFQPAYARAWNNLGNAKKGGSKSNRIECAYRRAIAVHPDFAEAWGNYGNLLQDKEGLSTAAAIYRRVLVLAPDNAGCWGNQGILQRESGQRSAARMSFQRALCRDPHLGAANNDLGVELHVAGLWDEARDCYIRSLTLAPEVPQVNRNFAVSLLDEGHPIQSSLWLDRAGRAAGDPIDDRRSHLAHAMYRDDLDAVVLRQLHQDFGASLNAMAVGGTRPKPSGRGRLRIAYLSSDFCDHPVGNAFLPVLRHHNRDDFEILLYSDTREQDAVLDRYRGLDCRWCDANGMTDEALASRIRADKADILVCLAGRFDRNRPQIAARQVAPVQISLHDVATSGIAEMDYIIGDRWLLSPRSGEFFTERCLRLPQFYLGALPAVLPQVDHRERQGSAVFGCFGNPTKITPTVLALWQKILLAMPDSRLVLRYRDRYGSDAQCRRILGGLPGIDPVRIDFASARDLHEQFLSHYNEIDIALDSIPFSGSTTSFQALLMGVPVVTWPSDRMVSQWTAAILRGMDLKELIAGSANEYVAIALKLAAHRHFWRRRRMELRQAVLASRFCDAAGWTAHLERLYKATWARVKAKQNHGQKETRRKQAPAKPR
ncbi:MAG TPA: tetratricopeptide repeat protein [Rhodospirillaceae bacterium]|nr:tetratricopeptide repeat protein [Rhodospirillaceae bacterium]